MTDQGTFDRTSGCAITRHPCNFLFTTHVHAFADFTPMSQAMKNGYIHASLTAGNGAIRLLDAGVPMAVRHLTIDASGARNCNASRLANKTPRSGLIHEFVEGGQRFRPPFCRCSVGDNPATRGGGGGYSARCRLKYGNSIQMSKVTGRNASPWSSARYHEESVLEHCESAFARHCYSPAD